MAKTKRPAETTPARASKKRKAAEAGKVKIREIAETEIDDDDDLLVVEAENEDRDDVGSVDLDMLEEEEVAADEQVLVPGFRPWETTSMLTSGAALSDMAKFNESTGKFSHVLDVQSTNAFALKPMLLTQGPFKGRRIFMLEPVASFRFMQLPPEIRNMVYSYLLEEHKSIRISTTKVTHEPRRPVRRSFREGEHKGLIFDRSTHKWVDQAPSAHSVLRVSKQIFREAATIAYGKNRFECIDMAELKVFLDHIGGMRSHIRQISIAGRWAFPHNNSKACLRLLKDATALRTLSFYHISVCQKNPHRWSATMSPERLVSFLGTTLRALHRAHKKSKSGFDLLEMIKVKFRLCKACKGTKPDYNEIKVDETEDDTKAVGSVQKKQKQKVATGENDDVGNTVIAPGFRPWLTESTLISGKGLAESSGFDNATQNFSHAVNVQHNDAFTLVPIVHTEGYFKGCRAFILQPITAAFRILDMPPEIRSIIYGFLLNEDETIYMTTAKADKQPRRPARSGYSYSGTHPGLVWDKKADKFLNQAPSALAILRVNKQMLNEAAPIVYGNNHFHFKDFSDLQVFLDTIGSMRQYLRHIHFSSYPYMTSKARHMFITLKESINLQTLEFDHNDVCGNLSTYSRSHHATPERFVSDSKALFKSLNKTHRDLGLPYSALNVLKLRFPECFRCDVESSRHSRSKCIWTDGRRSCNVECKDGAAHCREVEAKFREMIAKELGLKQ